MYDQSRGWYGSNGCSGMSEYNYSDPDEVSSKPKRKKEMEPVEIQPDDLSPKVKEPTAAQVEGKPASI